MFVVYTYCRVVIEKLLYQHIYTDLFKFVSGTVLSTAAAMPQLASATGLVSDAFGPSVSRRVCNGCEPGEKGYSVGISLPTTDHFCRLTNPMGQ